MTDKKEEWLDPVVRFVRQHKDVSEHLEFLTEIPDLIEERKHMTEILRAEEFFEKSLQQHFLFEEKMIFSVILDKLLSDGNKSLVSHLRADHAVVERKLKEFKKIITENVYPYKKDVIAQINLLLDDIKNILTAHMKKEDIELYPIVKNNRNLF